MMTNLIYKIKVDTLFYLCMFDMKIGREHEIANIFNLFTNISINIRIGE